MPRSVITASKQHYAFQQEGFSRIIDLKGVEPLFKVETCVMIRKSDNIYFEAIPTTLIKGKLPAHECNLSDADNLLIKTRATTEFIKHTAIASPYHSKMINGAALYPRTLLFVASIQNILAPNQRASTPIMCTNPKLKDDPNSKAPWKNLRLEGFIHEDFLYATLLSKNLVPFGVGKLHLVALPVKVDFPPKEIITSEKRFVYMSPEEMRDKIIFAKSADDWFEPAEKLWEKYKSDKVKETLFQWVNYQNKITGQSAEPGYLVLYGATGTNLAAAVIDTHKLPVINGVQPQAFIVDHTTYWYRCSTMDEAHFLVALLNAPCVDQAIKKYQTRGQFGERHVHRRPFEVCAIPIFDPSNPQHLQLAKLSQNAHMVIAGPDHTLGEEVGTRKQSRQSVRVYLDQIDEIAKLLLGLSIS